MIRSTVRLPATISAIAVSVIALLGCDSSQPRGTQSTPAGTPKVSKVTPSPEELKMLQDLIELRNEAVSNAWRKYSSGLSPLTALIEAHNKLYEARYGLAEAQDDHEAMVAELQKIVTALKDVVQQAERKVEAEVLSPADLIEPRAALLEARIRLARETRALE